MAENEDQQSTMKMIIMITHSDLPNFRHHRHHHDHHHDDHDKEIWISRWTDEQSHSDKWAEQKHDTPATTQDGGDDDDNL